MAGSAASTSASSNSASSGGGSDYQSLVTALQDVVTAINSERTSVMDALSLIFDPNGTN